MPRYDYRARDQDGNALTGVVEAGTENIARETLQDKGYFVISIDEQARKSVMEFELPFFNKIPIREMVIFSRQFAVLMGAKVPLVKALSTVAGQTKHPKLKQMLNDIASEVESGTSLSIAMSKYEQAFSSFFVNMIKSGETTGRLEDVMNYLAEQMERDYDMNAKIKGAMIYPTVVIFGLVIVGFIMMTFVIPKLTDVLAESGAELPWTTKLLIATSGFVKGNAILIVVGAVIAVGVFQWWSRQERGRQIWDRVKLSLPVFGPLLRNVYIIRFTRSFSTLLSGGVDIPTSLQICSEVVGNAHYEKLLKDTKTEVTDGNSITSVLATDPVVPAMVPQMMSVGEETGRLGEVLEKLTEFYSRELGNSVDNLVSAIEPLIMLVMGGAVGIMVAAIMLPMYNMATQF